MKYNIDVFSEGAVCICYCTTSTAYLLAISFVATKYKTIIKKTNKPVFPSVDVGVVVNLVLDSTVSTEKRRCVISIGLHV